LDWYEQGFFQIMLAGAMALIFTFGPLSWAATNLRKGRRFNKYKLLVRDTPHLFWRISLVYCTLTLAFLSGLSITIVIFRDDFIYGPPLVLLPLLCLPLITSLLTPALLVGTALAWLRRYWNLWQRLYYSLLSLTALVFVEFLLYWNLLGFHY
jgi:hypothetical protein